MVSSSNDLVQHILSESIHTPLFFARDHRLLLFINPASLVSPPELSFILPSLSSVFYPFLISPFHSSHHLTFMNSHRHGLDGVQSRVGTEPPWGSSSLPPVLLCSPSRFWEPLDPFSPGVYPCTGLTLSDIAFILRAHATYQVVPSLGEWDVCGTELDPGLLFAELLQGAP